jgi:hypothetical protein
MKYFDWLAHPQAFSLSAYLFIVSFLLYPGVLINYIKKGSVYLNAALFGLLMTVIWHFTSHFAWRAAKPDKY